MGARVFGIAAECAGTVVLYPGAIAVECQHKIPLHFDCAECSELWALRQRFEPKAKLICSRRPCQDSACDRLHVTYCASCGAELIEEEAMLYNGGDYHDDCLKDLRENEKEI